MHTVRPFSLESLIQVALEYWGSDRPPRQRWALREEKQVRTKRQLIYLADHLASADLMCRTMVVEPDYIDGTFLDDYASYYARCHASYGRKCVRVHFFKCAFDQNSYDAMLQGDVALRSLLTAHGAYLGFTVLKPLPTAFVGRTCVSTYGDSGSDEHGMSWVRQYGALQRHRAHLAGLELSVSSLAYQEQDSVTAACATTAIWCALQKIAPLFDLAVPTPAEITRRASENSESLWRTMPSEGLDVRQMCRALKSFGLDVEVRDDHRHELNVRETIYAYGSLGLPIILALCDPASGPDAAEPTAAGPVDSARVPARSRSAAARPAAGSSVDGHAVVVGGIGIQQGPTSGPTGGPVHERIVRLYVHDDQVGPYARAKFDERAEHRRKGKRLILSDPRVKGTTQPQDVYAIVVPVHPLIRVRNEAVRLACEELELVLEPPPSTPAREGARPEFRWDVRLQNGYDVVEALRTSPEFTSTQRSALVPHAWPRFVWSATAWCRGAAIADVLVDASDIERSFLPSHVVLRAAWRDHLRALWKQRAWLESVLPGMEWPTKTSALLGAELRRLGGTDAATPVAPTSL